MLVLSTHAYPCACAYVVRQDREKMMRVPLSCLGRFWGLRRNRTYPAESSPLPAFPDKQQEKKSDNKQISPRRRQSPTVRSWATPPIRPAPTGQSRPSRGGTRTRTPSGTAQGQKRGRKGKNQEGEKKKKEDKVRILPFFVSSKPGRVLLVETGLPILIFTSRVRRY